MTIKTSIGPALLLALLAAPAAADLKYTARVSARASTVPMATVATPNPFLAMIASLIVSTVAPADGLDTTASVSASGTRTDYRQAFAMVPAGGALIARADGTTVILDPAAKTYSRVPRVDGAALGGVTPKMTFKHTGEFVTIAGARAERLTIETRIALPVPGGAARPAGMPAEVIVTGDVWVAERYKNYAELMARSTGVISAFGLDRLASEGLVMRSIMRGELFGDREIETVITQLSEEPVPVGSYDIPAGFTEAAAPIVLPAGAAPKARD
ncbi:MAG: hypothetical protein ABI652_08455 [Acidobacteriota bacterium]